jgi:hypothetical protein
MAADILQRVAEPPALIAPLAAATCIGSQPEPVRGLCVERAPWPNSFHVKQVIAVGHDRDALRVRAADMADSARRAVSRAEGGDVPQRETTGCNTRPCSCQRIAGKSAVLPRRIAIAQQSLGSG